MHAPIQRTRSLVGILSILAMLASMTAIPAQTTPNSSSRVERREPWTSSRLKGTPTPPEKYRVDVAFPRLRFDHPTSLLELPGTGRLMVAEIGGRIMTFINAPETTEAPLAGDLAVITGKPVSLFAAVAHPKFELNRYVYCCFVDQRDASHTSVSRFTLTQDEPPVLDPTSEQVILTWPSGGHNAGCMRFGTDGLLYIATGDGSGPNPPDGLTTGQDVSDLLGAILRIDVDSSDGSRNYAIPADNPFISLPGARPEIFAYGLRNPWKFGIDQQSNEVYVADNGWETWELIYRVGPGTNCGWPIMEGRSRLRTEVKPGPTLITTPIRDHHHSEANSVIGGPVCYSPAFPELKSHFIYGDYITGTIWAVGRESGGDDSGQTLVDTDLRITEFMQSTAGDIFVVDYDLTGQIYRLQRNTAPDLSASFPRRLSETGLFQSLKPLVPAPGVEFWDVVAPRWDDGAAAQRFVAVPGDQRISVAPFAGQPAEYPEGTVFARHLTIPDAEGNPGSALETQILQRDQGVWNAYSYVWNDDGTDAALASSSGSSKVVKWSDPRTGEMTERTWRTNALNECRLCHNAGPGFVLGFNGIQLDRACSQSPSQLDYLVQRGVVRSVPEHDQIAAWKLVNPHDESQSLNDRARSWLHSNCSMCHHRGGNAIVSFYLTRNLSFDELNTNKGTIIGTFGMTDARIIVPGDPWRSILMYRTTKLGYARMPYIGSHAVDSQGVRLIADWIRSLPAGDRALSPPLVPSSSEGRALAALQTQGVADEVRNEAVRTLIGTSEGAMALASLLHSGELTSAEMNMATEAVRNAPADIRGLFDDFIPESLRRKTLGRTFEASEVLSLTGDSRRGRLIFFSDAARCRACHDVDDASKSIGPTLREIAKKNATNADVLQHVVQPSLRVDEKFAAWIAVLIDGRVVTGLQHNADDQQVTLRTADGKTQTIPRAEIEELRRSGTSLMPDGVLSDLTAEEAADLLAFIRGLASETTSP